MTILVTGGAGFIGSNFVLDWLAGSSEPVVVLDALTYAGNKGNLRTLATDRRHVFVHGSIADGELVGQLLRRHQVRAIVNLAAESHVDRSISGPESFFETNVLGTLRLLEAVRNYTGELGPGEREAFRFLHVSTDEVYGTLGPEDPAFTETTQYRPNSPYAASKASSDHLVRSYRETFGLKTLVTNCSNNYGPYQFPEKLIPLVIHNALASRVLPIYGDGQQVRDWLHVSDHCAALRMVLQQALPGATYNIGGGNQTTNLEVVHAICALLDERRPRADGRLYSEQIAFVADRPGHDRRYAIDTARIARDLGWRPAVSFVEGIARTVDWYLDHPDWVADVTSGAYRDWIARQYR